MLQEIKQKSMKRSKKDNFWLLIEHLNCQKRKLLESLLFWRHSGAF